MGYTKDMWLPPCCQMLMYMQCQTRGTPLTGDEYYTIKNIFRKMELMQIAYRKHLWNHEDKGGGGGGGGAIIL